MVPLIPDGRDAALDAGEFNDARVEVPVRWLSGVEDPVITPDLIDGYGDHITDFEVELVEG